MGMDGSNYLRDEKKDELVEFIECYEKVMIDYVNMFYKVPPSPKAQKQIAQQASEELEIMRAETEVGLLEMAQKLQTAVEKGEMLPERMQLEIEKRKREISQQLEAFEIEIKNKLQAQAEVI